MFLNLKNTRRLALIAFASSSLLLATPAMAQQPNPVQVIKNGNVEIPGLVQSPCNGDSAHFTGKEIRITHENGQDFYVAKLSGDTLSGGSANLVEIMNGQEYSEQLKMDHSIATWKGTVASDGTLTPGTFDCSGSNRLN